jgi:hypothetical protein
MRRRICVPVECPYCEQFVIMVVDDIRYIPSNSTATSMSQNVRYQVFVSSTFTDLVEERAEVLQAIWELDCIPTGMEAFLATNESQWDVIQKVIDECDYYILIVGGRYGSVTSDGISYTEKEYNYAKKLGIPVLGFVHGEPENIPVAKTEKEESGRLLLQTFREKVMLEYPVRKWVNHQELGGLVSRSLSRAIKITPRPGWVRNTGSSSLELLEQINDLTKENAALQEQIKSVGSFGTDPSLYASGADVIEIEGITKVFEIGSPPLKAKRRDWRATASWDDIFRDVGSILMNEATEENIRKTLARFIAWSKDVDRRKERTRDTSVLQETFAEIIVQLRALGLIQKGTRKRAVSDRESYWALTQQGDQYLVGLLARKKGATTKVTPEDIDEI